MSLTPEYTSLGRTEIQVSRLCLGTWQVSGWSNSDDSEQLRIIAAAIDNGINFIDTAASYGKGHSEELVGKAIKQCRDKVILATKFPYKHARPDQIRQSLEESLSRLGTDYIDLYQQHWPPKSPPLEESIAAMESLKAEGKIRMLGVSNWMEPEWEEFDNPARIESLQPCYSLLFRTIERSVLPLCEKHQIAILPYSPLCQGILTGKFRSLEGIPKDPRNNNRFLKPDLFPLVLSVLELLDELSAKYDRSLAQIALRWLLQQPGVTAPIVGCTSLRQLEDNLGVFGWELTGDDLERLELVTRPALDQFGAHDTLWNWHPREM